jgi:DNA-binding LacI/PurR family transcriptional regulator
LEVREKLNRRKWSRRFVAIIIIFGLAYSIFSDPRIRGSLGKWRHAGGKPVEITLAIGDIKQVSGRKEGNLLLFRDQRTIEAWINTVYANDEGAAYLIGFSDMVIPVPDQTKVTVIDTALSHTSPPLNIAQVRVLEGRYYGYIGWAQVNDLR